MENMEEITIQSPTVVQITDKKIMCSECGTESPIEQAFIALACAENPELFVELSDKEKNGIKDIEEARIIASRLVLTDVGRPVLVCHECGHTWVLCQCSPCSDSLISHIVPRQLLINPRSLHLGHIHMTSSFSGSMNPIISSWHGLRLGRLRHFTVYSGGYSGSGNEDIITIAAKYSAIFFACGGSVTNSPSPSRK
ncbi:MAG: hypothetical protein ACOYL3_06425 [Desulfuromonadaceae bacterium]